MKARLFELFGDRRTTTAAEFSLRLIGPGDAVLDAGARDEGWRLAAASRVTGSGRLLIVEAGSEGSDGARRERLDASSAGREVLHLPLEERLRALGVGRIELIRLDASGLAEQVLDDRAGELAGVCGPMIYWTDARAPGPEAGTPASLRVCRRLEQLGYLLMVARRNDLKCVSAELASRAGAWFAVRPTHFTRHHWLSAWLAVQQDV